MMRGQLRQAIDDEGPRPTAMEVEANVEEGIGNGSQKVSKVEEGIDRLNDSQKKKQKMQTNKGQGAIAKAKEGTFEGD